MEYILYVICNVYKHSKDYYDLCFYSIVNFPTSKGETSDTKFNHRMSVTRVAARDHAGCPGLGPNLWPGGCPMVMPLSGPHWWEWPALPPGVLVFPGQSSCWGTCLAPRPYDTQGLSWYSWHHQELWEWPGSVQSPENISVSEDHAIADPYWSV